MYLNPLFVTAAWIGMSYIVKALVLNLGTKCIYPAYGGVVVFPFLFMEDLVPFYVFPGSEELTWDFWLTVCLLCLWEFVRDTPELKQQVLNTLLCKGNKKSVFAKKMPVWMRTCMEVCCVSLIALFGGGVASEAVGEMSEEAAAETTDKTDASTLGTQIDLARGNMIGELLCVIVAASAVCVAELLGLPSILSPIHVLILCSAEAVSTTCAFLANTWSLYKINTLVPRMDQSRLVTLCMMIAMTHVSFSVALAAFNGMPLDEDRCRKDA